MCRIARRGARIGGSGRGARADHALPVEGLAELGLQRLECRPRAPTHADIVVGDVVAGAVDVPGSVLVLAGDLPYHLVSAGRLLGAERHPWGGLPGHDRRIGEAKLGPCRAADRIEEIVGTYLDQAGLA